MQNEQEVAVNGSGGLQILRAVLPRELVESPKMMGWVQETIDEDPFGSTLNELLADIYEGRTVLWTWEEGILMTSFRETSRAKGLVVTNLRGKNYLANATKIEHDYGLIAKAFDCTHLLGDVHNEALAKVYEKHGAKIAYRVMREV
jgi:hypothetical protein